MRRLPIDIVKIDRSFVGGLGSNEEDGAIVSAIVLAHSPGRDAVAEGIEETGQADTLRDLECPYGQGYVYTNR